MYAKTHTSAMLIATHLATNADAILRRILRWQSIIYQEPTLAGMPWLKDQLVNCNPHELVLRFGLRSSDDLRPRKFLC